MDVFKGVLFHVISFSCWFRSGFVREFLSNRPAAVAARAAVSELVGQGPWSSTTSVTSKHVHETIPLFVCLSCMYMGTCRSDAREDQRSLLGVPCLEAVYIQRHACENPGSNFNFSIIDAASYMWNDAQLGRGMPLATWTRLCTVFFTFASASAQRPPAGAVSGATAAAPQQFWNWLVTEGVLNESYVNWVNCEGEPWDRFRRKFVSHIEGGKWNFGQEEAWVAEPDHWELVKEAELITEMWRRQDLKIREGDFDASAAVPQRSFNKVGTASVKGDVLAQAVAAHLDHVMSPGGTVSMFAGSCLQGLVAALCVLGRALTVLGTSTYWQTTNESEDGFLLWRVEMGFMINGILLQEGLSLLDLTAAPGWPGVTTRFVEQLLHRPLKAGDFGMPGHQARSTAVIGSPRRVPDPVPARMPCPARRHAGTDPQGVTSWGRHVAEYMSARANALALATTDLPAGRAFPWHRIGLPYKAPDFSISRQHFLPGWLRRVRMLALVSQHGALDLEIPELLLRLFPTWFDPQFVLEGSVEKVCAKTEGSRVMDVLCPAELLRRERIQRHRRHRSIARHRRRRRSQRPGWIRRWGRPDVRQTQKRRQLFERRNGFHPRDPRLWFRDVNGPRTRPDVVTCTSFLDAIQLSKRFPDARLLIYFGPPVMINVAEDVQLGNTAIVEAYWRGVRSLTRQAVTGEVFIAAESLFRSEQFFWQTGAEVPFLRPMSVWINATYTPLRSRHNGGELLIHNRGRLKYETAFLTSLQFMAGAKFPYRIVAQMGRIIPFREVAGFHAVVIIPWSPELCMLRHLFKMHVPLAVPELSLLRNLVHISNMRLMPYPYNTPDPQSNRGLVDSIHPFDPFTDTTRTLSEVRGSEARAYWAEYSEYLLLPEMIRFSSSADLLAKLNTMEGRKVSQRMRAAYRNDLMEMQDLFQELLPVMLG